MPLTFIEPLSSVTRSPIGVGCCGHTAEKFLKLPLELFQSYVLIDIGNIIFKTINLFRMSFLYKAIDTQKTITLNLS